MLTLQRNSLKNPWRSFYLFFADLAFKWIHYIPFECLTWRATSRTLSAISETEGKIKKSYCLQRPTKQFVRGPLHRLYERPCTYHFDVQIFLGSWATHITMPFLFTCRCGFEQFGIDVYGMDDEEIRKKNSQLEGRPKTHLRRINHPNYRYSGTKHACHKTQNDSWRFLGEYSLISTIMTVFQLRRSWIGTGIVHSEVQSKLGLTVFHDFSIDCQGSSSQCIYLGCTRTPLQQHYARAAFQGSTKIAHVNAPISGARAHLSCHIALWRIVSYRVSLLKT